MNTVYDEYRPGWFEKLLLKLFPNPFDIVKEVDGKNHLYLRRFHVFRSKKLGGLYIHHILRPDEDRHLHDHPWDFWSLILRGWYLEEMPNKKAKNFSEMAINTDLVIRDRWSFRKVVAEQLHRIFRLSNEGVWSLIFVGPKKRHWGFNEDGVWVHWQEYLKKYAPESLNQTKNGKPVDPDSALLEEEI